VADQPASALTTPLIYTLALDPVTHLPAADILNAAEQSRLAAIRHPERAREFLASRLLLRQALHHASVQVGVATPDFSRLPAAGPPPSLSGLQAGLSHAPGHIACAVHHSPVGVDIECSDRRPPWRSLARRWFSDVEQQWLERQEPGKAFLMLWTLKEAWLKANHWGIAGNLQSLRLSTDSAEKPVLSADTQGRAWYAATACHQGVRMAVVWEKAGTPHVLTCEQLAGDPVRAFAPMALAWQRVPLTNRDRRQA